MKYLFLKFVILFFLSDYCVLAQNQKRHVKVEQMTISWEFEKDNILFTASAPDDGWVALGFNTEDDIVGSNLIMVNVKNNGAKAEDFYVVSAGNPKLVTLLGSESQIIEKSGFEIDGKTTVKFTLPVKAFDKYHQNLKKGDTIWLICAYSMEDEFDHHSRMRKHIKVTL
ncbi:DOMON domain-containing protein [Flagellimonas sp. HMM57]|uniref:DOMON domain-containing protein n=1 Tax=unclassified Flagellimonas TaxID=2644544 RepID=UPI0013D35D1E|nr:MULTISPECIES: DOMON domain-containing protein [unclassified Flagellimonas]UII76836.1 DOMON domain-containing protein [Flagellimonas sp. HMM57]